MSFKKGKGRRDIYPPGWVLFLGIISPVCVASVSLPFHPAYRRSIQGVLQGLKLSSVQGHLRSPIFPRLGFLLLSLRIGVSSS